MRKFATLLARYIEISGMKQTYIASTAGISYNYLMRLLAGDRNPSSQVVYKLAETLHLSPEQTGQFLSAAGYAPPATLFQAAREQKTDITTDIVPDHITRMAQQFFRLAQDVPDDLQPAFLEEMKHLFSYVRYKYILSGGANVLELNSSHSLLEPRLRGNGVKQQALSSLDLIAQIVGELHTTPEGEPASSATQEHQESPQAVENVLSAIDRLTGEILIGEVSSDKFQAHLVVQILDVLTEGAPWEIRRRVAEALPGLCRLDAVGAKHLMEALRLDIDDIRGVDIRRRVIEALPALTEISPESPPFAVGLLRPRPGDDKYVALTVMETSEDILEQLKRLPERGSAKGLQVIESPGANDQKVDVAQNAQAEIIKLQRQLLIDWEGAVRESLQFSLALHNLLCAPDTALLSLQEGLESAELLLQWVAARYLERLLPLRPMKALELYQQLLHRTMRKNIRRTVAKALPALLQCLEEASLSTRVLARSVISDLAADPDIYIRRAVADHALHLFSIDREFSLVLLRQMQKDSDSAIRHRLQPVALKLAQIGLIWYAQAAGLVDTKRPGKALEPFGD